MRLRTFRAGDKPDQVRRAVTHAVQSFGDDARAVVLVTSGLAGQADLMTEVVRAATDAATGLPVVGMTSSGAHFTEKGSGILGAAGAVLGGPEIAVQAVLERGLKADAEAAAQRAVGRLDKQGGRGNTVFAFADGLACDGNALAQSLRQAIPVGWRAVGGMAGDDWQFKQTFVFYEGQLVDDAIVLLYVSGGPAIRAACTNGYQAIDGARDLEVTELDGRGIRTLNGVPAAAIYAEELKRAGVLRPGEEPQPVMARFPLGFAIPFGEGVMIRTPLSIEDDGTVAVNAGLREGDLVRIQRGDTDSVMESAKALSAAVAGDQPEAAMFFDCGGRREIFRHRYAELVDAFGASLDGAPTLGITTYGEIAVYGGQAYPFHNYTAVAAAW